MMARAARWLAPLAILALALAVWEVTVRVRETPDWLLPPPSAIGHELWSARGLLAHHTWITFQEVIVGFAAALVAGVVVAVAIDAWPAVERALYPIVVGSQAIPIVAIAPLLLVWFGYGLLPKVVVVGLIAFFPIVVNTVDGLRAADPELLALVRTFGAGRWTTFWLIKAPGALPALFSGARIGIALAVIGAVFGEYVGAKAGLGYLIDVSSARLLTARVFACIAILAAMAIGLFAVVSLIERITLPWRRIGVGTRTYDPAP